MKSVKVDLLVFLLLLFCFMMFLKIDQKRLKTEIATISAEISEIKQSNAELRNMVEYLMEAQSEQESEY